MTHPESGPPPKGRSDSAPPGGGRRRRTASITTGIVVAAGLAGTLGWLTLDSRSAPAGTPAVTTVPTSQAAVERTDVAERNQLTGTLGHAGSFTVIAPAMGTLTRTVDVGRVVRQGQSLYEVDGKPVMLMYGKRPVWRAFTSGMSNGADVQQLEAALRALGHGSGLTVDTHFSTATYRAIRRWQAATGLPVSGSIPLGQLVFLPQAARITGHSVESGATVQPGTPVETGTTDQRVVIVQLPTADLSTTHVGDRVTVLLADGHTQRQGRVVMISTIATTASPSSSSGSSSGADSGSAGGGNAGQSTTPVDIAVDGPIDGFVEQAQVQVFITAELHKDVLAVPIVSLRARPGGQYEVVAVDGGSPRHVPVTVGLFDDIDQRAEVSGPGLAEGMRVEVPSGNS